MAATIVRCDLPKWKTVLSPDLQLTPSPWHHSGLEGSDWPRHQPCYEYGFPRGFLGETSLLRMVEV